MCELDYDLNHDTISASFDSSPNSPEMASPNRIFSLQGQGLKLNSREDIQPHLKGLDAIEDLEEVHFGGNTLGVEACIALGEVLKKKTKLKVRVKSMPMPFEFVGGAAEYRLL